MASNVYESKDYSYQFYQVCFDNKIEVNDDFDLRIYAIYEYLVSWKNDND